MSGPAALAAIVLAQTTPAPTPPTPAPATATQPASNSLENFGGDEVSASFQAAQAARGPLDGRWRLAVDGGDALYVFQISDAGVTPADAPQIEGAWGNLRRDGALDASGPIAAVQREAGGLTILFFEGPEQRARRIELRPTSTGAWTGELAADGAQSRVTMTRD